jgi:hypothetical protein
VPSGSVPSAGGGGGGGTPGTNGGGGTSTTTGGGTTGGGTTGGGISGGGNTTVAAPGVTATTVYIGTAYIKNQGAANATVGAGNLNEGDARKPYQVMIDLINKQGGLARRKLVQVPYGYDATSTQTVDQQFQAACAHWTQDNKVFAMFVQTSPIADECAKKAGAMEFAFGPSSPQTYQQFPDRIDIDGINSVREASVTASGLSKQGYFDTGTKLGFVTWDDPAYRQAVRQGYVPALKRYGVSITQIAYLHSPQTAQEVGQTSADAGSAVLKFKSLGIDHVIILDGPSGDCLGACIMLEWMRQAQSQSYFPRYGLNDSDGPPSAALKAGLVPASQLHRSVSVGWIDYEKSTEAGWHQNQQRLRCEAIMRKHGIDMSNLNALAAALRACREIWFLQAAFSHIGNVVSDNNLINAINGLGYSYLSPVSYANFFSATRHDGIGAVRLAVFNDGCSCYKYPAAPYRV